MSENQKKILEMLADKKISVDEAYRLLSLVEPEKGNETASFRTTESNKPLPKYMRVVVQPDPNGGDEASPDKVNIRVPVALIRAGIKLTSVIPPHAVNKANEAIKEKGIDLDLTKIKPDDLEQLVDALSELEVDVQDGKAKVRVYME